MQIVALCCSFSTRAAYEGAYEGDGDARLSMQGGNGFLGFRLGYASLLMQQRTSERIPVIPLRWGLGYQFGRFEAQPTVGDSSVVDLLHGVDLSISWDAFESFAASFSTAALFLPNDLQTAGSFDFVVAYRPPFARTSEEGKLRGLSIRRDDAVDDVGEPSREPVFRDEDEEPVLDYPLELRFLLRVNENFKQADPVARASNVIPLTEDFGFSSASVGLGVAYRPRFPFSIVTDFRWYRHYDDPAPLVGASALFSHRQALGLIFPTSARFAPWLLSLPVWEIESALRWRLGLRWRLDLSGRMSWLASEAVQTVIGFGGYGELSYRISHPDYWDESMRGWILSVGGGAGNVTGGVRALLGSVGLRYAY